MLAITLFCFITQACCMLYRPPVVRQQSVYSAIPIPERRTHRNCCLQFVSKRTKVRKAAYNNAKNVIVHRNNIRASPKAKFLQLVKLFTFDQLQKPANFSAELQQIGITKSDIENPLTTKGGKFEKLLKTLASNDSSGVTSRNEKSHTGDIKEHYYMSSQKFNKILEQLAESAGQKPQETSPAHEDDGSAASADNDTLSKNEDFQRLQNMAFLSNLFSKTIQNAINQSKIRYSKANENVKKAENATSLVKLLDEQNGKDNFMGHLNSLINMLDTNINNVTDKEDKPSSDSTKEEENEKNSSVEGNLKEKGNVSSVKENSQENTKEDTVKTEAKENDTNSKYKASEDKVVVKAEHPKDEPKENAKSQTNNKERNVTKTLASYLDEGKPFLSSNDSLKRLEAATDAFIGKSNNDSSIKEFFELLKLLTMNKLGVSHTTIQVLTGDSDRGSAAKNAKLAAKNERNHYHYQVFPSQAEKAANEEKAKNASEASKGNATASNASTAASAKDKNQNKTHNLVSLGKLSDIRKMEKLLDLLSNTTENNDWKQNVYLDVSIRKFEDLLKHILSRKSAQKAAAASGLSKDKEKQTSDSNEHRSMVDTNSNSYVSLLNLSQWIDNPSEIAQDFDALNNKSDAGNLTDILTENSNGTSLNKNDEDVKEFDDVKYKELSHLSYYDMPQKDGDVASDALPEEHQRRHHASRVSQSAVVEKLEKVLKLITLRQLIHDLPNEEARNDSWEDRGETKSRIRYIQKFNHLLKLIALDRLHSIKD